MRCRGRKARPNRKYSGNPSQGRKKISSSHARAALEGLAGVDVVDIHDREVIVTARNGATVIGPVAVALAEHGVSLANLSLRTPTLDDVFLDDHSCGNRGAGLGSLKLRLQLVDLCLQSSLVGIALAQFLNDRVQEVIDLIQVVAVAELGNREALVHDVLWCQSHV